MKVFITLHFKQVFWKTKAFFKKLDYRFLVERTTIENAIFPYKATLPKANVKTNGKGSAKWTYKKEWFFVNIYFILRKI